VSAAHITVPDLVSYFPAIAAIVLDLFNREGLDVVHKPISRTTRLAHWAICALPAQALPARSIV
jgi:hypothetical protein